MEHEKFIEFLKQHAELDTVRVAANAGVREATAPEEIFRQGQVFAITRKNNPTFNIKIKKLKHEAKSCEDCGKMCLDRKIWRRIVGNPVHPHWRETCSSCNLTKHPETGTYSVSNAKVFAVFYEHLNNRDK